MVVVKKERKKQMAKTKIIAFGTLITVEKNNLEMDSKEWSWRKKYEGFDGRMEVFESTKRYPGKHYIIVYDIDLNWIKTGVGELTDNGDTFVLTTKNSKYTFKIEKEIYRKDGD